MEVSANMVKELREKTGAGMMDCKKALAETGGDFRKGHGLSAPEGAGHGGQAGRADRLGRAWSAPTSMPAARSA